MINGINDLFYMIFIFLLSAFLNIGDGSVGNYVMVLEPNYSTLVEVDEPEKPAMIEAYLKGDTDGYGVWNTYNLDMHSTDVVGMVGVPIKVEGNGKNPAEDELLLIFAYDESKLECEEADLGILWYNKPIDVYETLTDYEIDYELNRVTVPVNNLGTYILEDMETWTSVWTGTYDYSAYELKEPQCHWHDRFDYEDIEMLADISMYNDETTEYHITTVGQLAGLVKLVNEGNSFVGCDFYLDADLDLEGYDWVPIGWYYPMVGDYDGKDFPFEGRFYGNGHAIYNMSIVAPNQCDLGLFGRTLQEFEVHDLALIDCYVEGKYYVGGILGDNINYGDDFDMTNCVVSGTVKGESTVGALAGSSAYLRVKDCYAVMDEDGATNLVGDLRGGYLQTCFANNEAAEEALSKYE